MRDNPYVYPSGAGFGVVFTRRGGKALYWIQDITKRSMKSALVNRPHIYFDTREEAEHAILNDVIPHLLSEKGVERDEIIGWW